MALVEGYAGPREPSRQVLPRRPSRLHGARWARRPRRSARGSWREVRGRSTLLALYLRAASRASTNALASRQSPSALILGPFTFCFFPWIVTLSSALRAFALLIARNSRSTTISVLPSMGRNCDVTLKISASPFAFLVTMA